MFFLVSKSFSDSAIIAPKVENASHGKTGYVPFTNSRWNHSSNPCESTLEDHENSAPLYSPRRRGVSASSEKIPTNCLLVKREINGAKIAAIAIKVRTPGVCHSNLPPRSIASRKLTRNWQAVRIATLGRTQLIQAGGFNPSPNLFLAPRCRL